MTNSKHHYGWRPDTPDQRDHIFHAPEQKTVAKASTSWYTPICNFFHPTPTPPTPPDNKSVDLRSVCPPVVDQGQLGSCTANALAGALAFLEIKDNLFDNAFSRLFIYYNERVLENTVNSDAGAEIRDGIKTLAAQGACYETTWPYIIAEFTVDPPAAAYTEGSTHLILEYSRILTLADMQACLDAGFPFVFGFTVYESFESDVVTQTGVVPMPGPMESVLGGHAVVCVGYDDTQQRFICRNSWGTDWGMSGYFTIPYAYLTNDNLASDFWTIRRGEDMLHKPT